jgi:DeoR/GlpR family transcriptional regulator of sugar metabolism
VTNLRQYHSRWAFLSVAGLDELGATNTSQLVVESERAMIEQTENAVILADHSKWGHRDMIRQCDWSDISLLVTDRKPDDWTPPIAPEKLVVAPR